MDQKDRKAWQKRCVDIGFTYWREPDDHGVTCTEEQAAQLLAELLGVEVEITEPGGSDAAEDAGQFDPPPTVHLYP